jgi:hypothetical protein
MRSARNLSLSRFIWAEREPWLSGDRKGAWKVVEGGEVEKGSQRTRGEDQEGKDRGYLGIGIFPSLGGFGGGLDTRHRTGGGHSINN